MKFDVTLSVKCEESEELISVIVFFFFRVRCWARILNILLKPVWGCCIVIWHFHWQAQSRSLFVRHVGAKTHYIKYSLDWLSPHSPGSRLILVTLFYHIQLCRGNSAYLSSSMWSMDHGSFLSDDGWHSSGVTGVSTCSSSLHIRSQSWSEDGLHFFFLAVKLRVTINLSSSSQYYLSLLFGFVI